MQWQKIDLSGEDPAAIGSPVDLPADLVGLSTATLADLSGLAASRPDLDGVGYWPVTEVAEDLASPRLVTGEHRVEIERTLALRQAARQNAAASELARRVALGCAYSGKVAQIDEASQMRITAAVAWASAAQAQDATWPESFAWRMADNTFLAMGTATAMITFGQAVSTYVLALRARYWALRDAIAAAEDHADLDAIDVDTGWPSTGYPG